MLSVHVTPMASRFLTSERHWSVAINFECCGKLDLTPLVERAPRFHDQPHLDDFAGEAQDICSRTLQFPRIILIPDAVQTETLRRPI